MMKMGMKELQMMMRMTMVMEMHTMATGVDDVNDDGNG
jgi:hypothetical protein